jgi:hypothetical protein
MIMIMMMAMCMDAMMMLSHYRLLERRSLTMADCLIQAAHTIDKAKNALRELASLWLKRVARPSVEIPPII